METEKTGIKELSEALVFAISMGEALEMALADKKLGLEDLGLLVVPFTKAPDAVDGFGKIGAEIKDLDATEMAEIKQLVKTQLNLSNDKLEAKIEAGVDFLGAVYSLVAAIKA